MALLVRLSLLARIGFDEDGSQAGFDGFTGKGVVEGFEVAGEEVLFCPVELGGESRVFAIEGGVGDGSPIGIDTYGYSLTVEPVDRVVGEGGVNVCLQIAGGADL